MFWKIIGITAATLTSFGFLPQIRKMVKTKSVNDISLITVLQFTLGATLWMLYGIYLKDPIVILANLVCLITLIIALIFYRKYQQKSLKK